MGIIIFSNFPSSYLLGVIGLRWGILLGVAVSAVGIWIKVAINHSFTWVIVGQVITALGTPISASAPAKLAAEWFGPNERVVAITLAVVS
mmetsp:Transcript_35558/g.25968  ORF Transcript_35558/g.25968 Transcript_35558/m.25968 type:complete len:90 (+) Transcript_35558:338-607(+)